VDWNFFALNGPSNSTAFRTGVNRCQKSRIDFSESISPVCVCVHGERIRFVTVVLHTFDGTRIETQRDPPLPAQKLDLRTLRLLVMRAVCKGTVPFFFSLFLKCLAFRFRCCFLLVMRVVCKGTVPFFSLIFKCLAFRFRCCFPLRRGTLPHATSPSNKVGPKG